MVKHEAVIVGIKGFGFFAADDDGFQRKTGQQDALKPARPAARLARDHARIFSTSAANDAPPRIGSVTGNPSRSRSAAIKASTHALQTAPDQVPVHAALAARITGLRDALPESSLPFIDGLHRVETERLDAEPERCAVEADFLASEAQR